MVVKTEPILDHAVCDLAVVMQLSYVRAAMSPSLISIIYQGRNKGTRMQTIGQGSGVNTCNRHLLFMKDVTHLRAK